MHFEEITDKSYFVAMETRTLNGLGLSKQFGGGLIRNIPVKFYKIRLSGLGGLPFEEIVEDRQTDRQTPNDGRRGLMDFKKHRAMSACTSTISVSTR